VVRCGKLEISKRLSRGAGPGKVGGIKNSESYQRIERKSWRSKIEMKKSEIINRWRNNRREMAAYRKIISGESESGSGIERSGGKIIGSAGMAAGEKRSLAKYRIGKKNK